MSNSIVQFQAPLSGRALAYLQQNAVVADELGAGITGGFGVLGIRGKVWHMKFRGEDKPIMAQTQPGLPPQAVPHIAAVIIAASQNLTKTWYESGYVEGSTEQPDCFSMNGEVPDPTSKKRQHTVCATCPHNRFGSRVSADGNRRGKACADSKRLAIVPSDDMGNEMFGGVMMLRVPAASLQPLQEYASALKHQGAAFFAVSTWLSFDPNEAYPRIMFTGHRPLTDEEFDYALKLRDDDQTKRIIESAEGIVMSDGDGQSAAEVGNANTAPQVSEAPPAPAPVEQPAPQAGPAPAPEIPSAPVETEEEKERREYAEWQAAKRAQQQPTPAAPPAAAPAPAPANDPVRAAAPPPAQKAPPVAQAAPGRAAAPPKAQTPSASPPPAGGPSQATQPAGGFTTFLDSLTS